MSTPQVEATAAFRREFDNRPDILAEAPGRVNLIGEHTDYNDGFVFPMALPFTTAIAAAPRSDGTVRLRSIGYDDAEFALGAEPHSVDGWARYVAGMATYLGLTTGFDGVIATDIPMGAGLSSSAALEVASGLLIAHLEGVDVERSQLARMGQRVENEIIGLTSGVMDQLISATALAGHVSLIDCRDYSSTPVPMPAGAAVVVCDTMTRRELVDSAYDERRRSCELVARHLGVEALRDATESDLGDLVAGFGENDDGLGDDVAKARHVITENERTLAAAEALGRAELALVGQLMNESHRSLRDDFAVSSVALDAMVTAAQSSESCYGARMTGGGFAGCAVALVDAENTDATIVEIESRYAEATGVNPQLWHCQPGVGASVEVIS